MKKTFHVAALCAALVGATPHGVLAQAEDSNAEATETEEGSDPREGYVDTIYVTAQKREENVQTIPISVSTFDPEFLEESNVTDVADLTVFAPGLSGTAEYDTQSVFTIRGIGTYAFSSGADNSVGVFVDDVSIGRPVTASAGFFDLERVEVVKGPQGTLFGRNTSAGAINLITRRPRAGETSLSLTLGAGNEGQIELAGVGNLSRSDRFAARLALRHEERDGTNLNTFTGDEVNERNHFIGRLGLGFFPSDASSWHFSVEAYDVDNVLAVIPVDVGLGGDIQQNFADRQTVDATRATLRGTWNLGGDLALTSITGYYDVDMVAVPVDVDATEIFFIDLREPWDIQQLSQELRLNGTRGSGARNRMDWFLGASYHEEDARANTEYHYSDFTLTQLLAGDFSLCDQVPVCQDFVVEFGVADNTTQSYALYGDASWEVGEKGKITFGARFTQDEKEMTLFQPLQQSLLTLLLGDNLINNATDGTVRDDESWSSFDPRIAFDYAVTPDVLWYVNVGSGYKSGGYNKQPDRLLIEGVPQKPATFDEENNLAYEVGLKSRLADGRAQINAAIFFYDYEDIQVEDQTGLSILIRNAASAETKGLEVDARAFVTDRFEVLANYAYLDAEITRGSEAGVDVSGLKLLRAPEHTGALIGRYTRPLANAGLLTLRGEYAYTGQQFYDLQNTESQDAYGVVNTRIDYTPPSDKWGLALVGQNVLDETYTLNITAPLGTTLGIPAWEGLWKLEFRLRL